MAKKQPTEFLGIVFWTKMKVVLFILIVIILHIVAFLGLFLALFEVFDPALNSSLLKMSLIAIGVLVLSDIIFGLYFLINKPSKQEGSGYHKLKIEEADKHATEK
ncbi:hypothetical protein M1O57_01560 [Dehalococcoidia bacterium]|nr:hypothetical protein [Dehalococcoidia bacterium]MCL0104279.1 hypothetical protein [Dehalococcoidia bacterium]